MPSNSATPLVIMPLTIPSCAPTRGPDAAAAPHIDLVERAKFVAGETVLVRATGVSCRLAAQSAKHLRAKR